MPKARYSRLRTLSTRLYKVSRAILKLGFAELLVRSAPAEAVLSRYAMRFPFLVNDAKNVMLETVKRGEGDGQGEARTIVLRLHEHMGGSAMASLRM